MKHDVTPELAAAFQTRAVAMGYTVMPSKDEHLLFSVHKHGMEVCQFEKNGAQRYYPDMPLVEERLRLNRIMADMKQAHDLYVDAPPFNAVDVKGFRLISAFENMVLAARMSADNEVRFVTWQYTYDRTGVTLGHYYETNYEGAKKDFATRAGLLDENQLFTEDEMAALYAAAIYRGSNDGELSYDDGSALDQVIAKIQYNIPHRLCNRDEEQVAEQEPDMEV